MTIQFKNMAVVGTLLSTVAFSAPVSADAMVATGGYNRELHTMGMMKMIDANGDHMVSNAEFTDYYGSLFDALDTNKDGAIDAKEWVGTKGNQGVSIATGGYSTQLRTMKVMGAMDTDGDHKVTRDEFIKFHEDIFKTMAKGGTEVDGKGWQPEPLATKLLSSP